METNQNYSDPLWRQAKKRTGFKIHLTVYLLVNIFLWGLWFFIKRHEGASWPIWTTLGWGIGICFHLMNTYATFKIFSTEKEYKKLKSKNI